ncbi:MAG TPA: T9SS type A sorting domain-containing protein [Lentimicrobium sp.]|nr:T9SS type A sorting domain-containing protein [Lentimicrobium sp.]
MKSIFIATILVINFLHVSLAQQWKGFDDEFGCNYTWKQSTYGANMGVNSMYSGDIDNDGVCEMIFSATTSGWDETTLWYVLEHNSITGNYDQVFISHTGSYEAEISVIEVFDGDNDGDPEVVVGYENGTIEFWNALTFELERTITVIEEPYYYNDILSTLTADADNDGAKEFVCGTRNKTFLYSLPSFELNRIIDRGAPMLKCANVNNDPYTEMVFSDGMISRLTSESDELVEVKQLIPTTNEYWQKLELKDFNNDQTPDIVLTSGKELWVIQGKSCTTKFIYTFEYEINAIAVADGDGDGQMEIIAAEYQEGEMKCFEIDGTEVWTVNNHGDAVSGITGGDLDNDGSPELLWGTGYGVTDDDFIHVCAVPGLAEEWKSTVYSLPYTAVEVGDVDNDGSQEIVTIEADEGYMSIFDANTRQIEWRIRGLGRNAYDLKLFDIDKDGLLEIIVCGQTLRVYNGITHELEPDFPPFGVFDSWEYRWFEIADIDNNGTYEYIISNGYSIRIMDPTDGGILWDSSDKSGQISYDFAVGNIDNDQELEIVSHNSSLEINIYDVPNNHQNTIAVPKNSTICMYDYNKDGILEVMCCEPDGKLGYYDGINFGYTQLPYMLKPNVTHMRFFEYPRAAGPVVAFVYDSKFCCSDNTGRFSREWLIGDDTADEIDITDYNLDGYQELFVLANTMITEVDLSCFLPVAIPEKEEIQRISIYPNPASDFIIAELDEDVDAAQSATLFDMRGIMVQSVPVSGNRTLVVCNMLPPGIYVLKIGELAARVVVK